MENDVYNDGDGGDGYGSFYVKSSPHIRQHTIHRWEELIPWPPLEGNYEGLLIPHFMSNT